MLSFAGGVLAYLVSLCALAAVVIAVLRHNARRWP